MQLIFNQYEYITLIYTKFNIFVRFLKKIYKKFLTAILITKCNKEPKQWVGAEDKYNEKTKKKKTIIQNFPTRKYAIVVDYCALMGPYIPIEFSIRIPILKQNIRPRIHRLHSSIQHPP